MSITKNLFRNILFVCNLHKSSFEKISSKQGSLEKCWGMNKRRKVKSKTQTQEFPQG